MSYSNSPRVVRIPEMQQRLGGVSRSTLYRWMNDGWLPKASKIGPNTVGWLEEDVVNWLNDIRAMACH